MIYAILASILILVLALINQYWEYNRIRLDKSVSFCPKYKYYKDRSRDILIRDVAVIVASLFAIGFRFETSSMLEDFINIVCNGAGFIALLILLTCTVHSFLKIAGKLSDELTRRDQGNGNKYN